MLEINKSTKEIKFQVDCSKGTYIRSLCEDIATKLNTIGTMSELKRLQVGNFKIEDAIQIEDVEKYLDKKLITIESLFAEEKQITLDNKKLQLFLNGVMLTCDEQDGIYRIYNNDIFVGIGIVQKKLLKSRR